VAVIYGGINALKNKLALLSGILCIGLVIAFIFYTGKDNQKKEGYTTTGFAMGTAVTVSVYSDQGRQDADAVIDCVSRLEREQISWRIEGSEVYRVNHEYKAGEPYEISYDLAYAVLQEREVSEAGDDLLALTIRPLASCWGIEDGKKQVPETQKIEEACSAVDDSKVHIVDEQGKELTQVSDLSENGTWYVLFDEAGLSLDFGAMGKGIACDRVAENLEENQVEGACVAVGGSVLCYGAKPAGSGFRIGIRDPRETENDMMGTIEVRSDKHPVYISTSGDYEKYFIQDGKRYHHILNPKTGYPADTGTISATVICESGALSDALSTMCILLPVDQAFKLVKSFDADAILIDEDKNIHMTEQAGKQFTITNGDYKVK